MRRFRNFGALERKKFQQGREHVRFRASGAEHPSLGADSGDQDHLLYFNAESHNNIGTWETAGNQSRELLRLLSTYATTRPLFLARFDRDFSLYPKP